MDDVTFAKALIVFSVISAILLCHYFFYPAYAYGLINISGDGVLRERKYICHLMTDEDGNGRFL